MARPLRVEYPGTYYHIINRANAGEKLFYFGGITGAAITMRYNRLNGEMNRNKRLKGKVRKAKNRLLNI